MVIVGGVIGAIVFRDRLTGAADALAVGDCIDLPTSDEFAEVQHQPCNEPHEAEIYVVQDWANPPEVRPSEAEFETWITEHCLGQAFTDYVGMTYEAADAIVVGWFSPTVSGWSDGDKEVVCYLAPAAGGTVSVSYRKAS